MAKRLKLRISRVFPSFQSCRSKDPSTLPSNPSPSILRQSPVQPPPQPPSKPRHSSFRRHFSSAFTSVGCVFRSKSKSKYLSDDDHHLQPPQFVSPRRKIYNSSASQSDNEDVHPPPPSAPPLPYPQPHTAERKKRRRRKKKGKLISKIRISTSSADSGIFSSTESYEETETLVSSRSFSSPEHLKTILETSINRSRRNKRKKKNHRHAKKVSCSPSPESLTPARLSVFQKLMPCTVDGKVRESFAVVKKSEDPYEDFKRSMMEMIMEKQIFEEKDLEELLRCFLELNSRNHHGIIVEAFSEIWDGMFCPRSTVVGIGIS